MKPGIERIEIINNGRGRGAYRFDKPKPARPHANRIYRSIFDLNPNDVVTPCTIEEKKAREDKEYGVDIILGFRSGMTATIQEKILNYYESTLTVEYMQNPDTGEEGDWFKLKVDYYFVGYARKDPAIIEEWILLDWNQVKLDVDQIIWYEKPNKRDGAKSSFRYAYFVDIPEQCVIASNYDKAQCQAVSNRAKYSLARPCPAPLSKAQPRQPENTKWAIAAQAVQTRFDDPVFMDAWNNEREHARYNYDYD